MRIIIYAIIFLSSLVHLNAQNMTTVAGRIVDANTKVGLPFATIASSVDQSVGTTTDIDGYYSLRLDSKHGNLLAEYLGYASQPIVVDYTSESQEINIELNEDGVTLGEVEIKATRLKYSRKNNPAVELIKKVIAHKDENRMEGQDYYQCNQYEKIEFSLNNFESSTLDKGYLKDLQFLKNHIDTSDLNGKPHLPFYLRERDSDIYYRSQPESRKEFIQAEKETKLDQWLFSQNITTILDNLYQDIDVYNNTIDIFAKSVVSPISSVVGNAFYHYHIIDTLDYDGVDVIELAFMPANKLDLGFKGSLLITNDSTYALVKAEMTLDERANINWISDLRLIQEFEKYGDQWIVSNNILTGDFSIAGSGKGLLGTRSVFYTDYIFNKPSEDKYYNGLVNVIDERTEDKTEEDDTYWNAVRPEDVDYREKEIYAMIDTMKNTPIFKRVANITSLAISGYWDFRTIEMGPVASFYSFNDVEGFKMKLGGATTPLLHPKLRLGGYAAYGFKDKRLKYKGEIEYSLNKNFRENPKTFFKLSHSHDLHIVGQDIDLVNESNLFLSFNRGDASKFVLTDQTKFEFNQELQSDLSYNIYASHKKEIAQGSLKFAAKDIEGNAIEIPDVTTTEVGINIRWAPNESFIQLNGFRKPIFNNAPIIELSYAKGINGILGSGYDYHKITGSLFKRLYLPPVGISDIIIEGGKIIGTGLPYYHLLVPRGNQTYFYKHRTFNMMNFLEFTSDTYFIVNYRHFFNGFIMNRVPLLNKLGLRSVVSFKGVWGQLSQENDPNQNPELLQFVNTADGVPETYTFSSKPYMEASFGIANIFKIARIDIVQRINYLDHPNVQQLFGRKGLGLRLKTEINF